jgi:hypothetical protein
MEKKMVRTPPAARDQTNGIAGGAEPNQKRY